LREQTHQEQAMMTVRGDLIALLAILFLAAIVLQPIVIPGQVSGGGVTWATPNADLGGMSAMYIRQHFS
jgi:hypothetical protein